MDTPLVWDRNCGFQPVGVCGGDRHGQMGRELGGQIGWLHLLDLVGSACCC